MLGPLCCGGSTGSRGDFSGVGDIHFFYSADEVLYGALPDFAAACDRAAVHTPLSQAPWGDGPLVLS